MQGRRKDGTVDPLEFEGQKIFIPGVREHSAGHPTRSMGVAVLAKKTRLKRIASLQGKTKKWQMLVVETDWLRLIGVYAKPKMPRPDWVALLSRLESYKENSRPTVVSGDLNAIYSAWTDGRRARRSKPKQRSVAPTSTTGTHARRLAALRKHHYPKHERSTSCMHQLTPPAPGNDKRSYSVDAGPFPRSTPRELQDLNCLPPTASSGSAAGRRRKRPCPYCALFNAPSTR